MVELSGNSKGMQSRGLAIWLCFSLVMFSSVDEELNLAKTVLASKYNQVEEE